MDSSLYKITSNVEMPLCIQKSEIKDFNSKTMHYIKAPHLQTSKHRFRTYPKPISKIVSL